MSTAPNDSNHQEEKSDLLSPISSSDESAEDIFKDLFSDLGDFELSRVSNHTASFDAAELEMNENDYRELQLSLGLSRQARSPMSGIQHPSPTTPGTQLEREARSARSQMASPVQKRRRFPRGKLADTPVKSVPESTETPRRPRKRAYEMLQQETANILKSWPFSESEKDVDMDDKSHGEINPKEAAKFSSEPQQTRNRTDSSCIPSLRSWNILPKTRIEVVMTPKRKGLVAAYEDVESISTRNPMQPRKGGHRGRGRQDFPLLFPKRPASRLAASTTIIPKQNRESKTKAVPRTVIGGRVGVIRTRRSQRMRVQNSDMKADMATCSAKGTLPSSTRSTPRRGRPPGPRKTRGRPSGGRK